MSPNVTTVSMMAICKQRGGDTMWASNRKAWFSVRGVGDVTTGDSLHDSQTIRADYQVTYAQHNVWQHTIISGAEEPRAIRVKLATDAFQTSTFL